MSLLTAPLLNLHGSCSSQDPQDVEGMQVDGLFHLLLDVSRHPRKVDTRTGTKDGCFSVKLFLLIADRASTYSPSLTRQFGKCLLQ